MPTISTPVMLNANDNPLCLTYLFIIYSPILGRWLSLLALTFWQKFWPYIQCQHSERYLKASSPYCFVDQRNMTSKVERVFVSLQLTEHCIPLYACPKVSLPSLVLSSISPELQDWPAAYLDPQARLAAHSCCNATPMCV